MVETAMSNKVHKLPSFYKHNQIKLHSETELPIIDISSNLIWKKEDTGSLRTVVNAAIVHNMEEAQITLTF